MTVDPSTPASEETTQPETSTSSPEQTAAADVKVTESSAAEAAAGSVSPAPVAVDPAAVAVEATTAQPEAQSATTEPRVAIGSQRDAAARPLQPKAVSAAVANPLDLAGEGNKAPAEDLGEILSDAGFGDDLDAEIEAALGGLSMDSVVDEAKASEVELEPGARIKATVSKIHNDDVFFKLEGQYEGIATLHHFKEAPVEGAEADVIVRSLNREDGLYELSVPGAAVGGADWDDYNEGDLIDALVTGSNSGGLEVTVGSLEGFMPASQISRVRVSDMEAWHGKKLQAIVVEINPAKRKFIVSHRGVMEREQQEKRAKLLETLEVGQFHEGLVVKLMDFGAFVDIGGVEGLAHISKLSWSRIKHPSEVLKEGDKVKVKIEKYDSETHKMSLSYRDTLEDPWKTIGEQFSENDIVKGTVTRIADFGAFVKIAPAIEGLVHISEISYKRVTNVSSVLSEGQEVEVKILSMDIEAQKASLSIKACSGPPAPKGSSGKPAAEEVDEPARELAVPASSEPLKGGRDRKSGGESIGLNW